MKVIEINNRKGTYIYDEEYNEFFSDDEVGNISILTI